MYSGTVDRRRFSSLSEFEEAIDLSPCERLLLSTFSSHDSLDRYSTPKFKAITYLCGRYEIEEFATFIALSNRCLSIGSIMYLYNKRVDRAVKSENFEFLDKLISRGKRGATEIYSNRYLSKDEVYEIDKMLDVEISSVKTYILNFRNEMNKENGGDKSMILPFINKCRKMVCQDRNMLPYQSSEDNSIYITSKPRKQIVSDVHCLKFETFLKMLSKTEDSDELLQMYDIDEKTLEKFRSSYSVEIGIYQHYVDKISLMRKTN